MRGIDPLRTSWVLELMLAIETCGTLVTSLLSSAADEYKVDEDEDDSEGEEDGSRKSTIDSSRATRCSSLSQMSATIPTSPLLARASCEHWAIISARLRTNRTASPKLMLPAATNAENSPRLCPSAKSTLPFAFVCALASSLPSRTLNPNSFSNTCKIAIDVTRIAGCAFSTADNAAFGPLAMMWEMDWECGRRRISSVYSRSGLMVRGKAASQGASMPTRCTPWPRDISKTISVLCQMGDVMKVNIAQVPMRKIFFVR